MKLPLSNHQIWSCKSKKRYGTERAALDRAEKSREHDPDLRLKVYSCKYCQGYHLAKK